MGKNDEFSYRDADVKASTKTHPKGDIKRFEYIGVRSRRDAHLRVKSPYQWLLRP